MVMWNPARRFRPRWQRVGPQPDAPHVPISPKSQPAAKKWIPRVITSNVVIMPRWYLAPTRRMTEQMLGTACRSSWLPDITAHGRRRALSSWSRSPGDFQLFQMNMARWRGAVLHPDSHG